MKRIISIFMIVLCVCSLCSCAKTDDLNFYDEFPTGEEINTIEIKKNPIATVTLENGSKIKIELYYYSAPNTVADFIALADAGIYEGMAFNIVRRDCIVIMGSLDESYQIPYYVMDEAGKSENALSHEAGVVSMIRTTTSDTVTGQFFILTDDQTHFDNRYTSFGKVIEGLEIVEEIAAAEKNENDELINPYVIKSVKIDTHGKKFPLPTIIPIDKEV